MPITVSGRSYVVAPGDATDGELVPAEQPPRAHVPADIGVGTRRALADYLSEASLTNLQPIPRRTVDAEVGLEPTTPSHSRVAPLPSAKLDAERSRSVTGDDIARATAPVRSYANAQVESNRATPSVPLQSYPLVTAAGDSLEPRRIAAAAATLAARAAGVPGSTDAGYDASAVSLDPTRFARLKARVADLGIADALREAADVPVRERSLSDSWGQMNDPSSPYAALSSAGVQAVAISLMGAVGAALGGIASLAAASVKPVPYGPQRTVSGRLAMGSSSGDGFFARVARSLGLTPTRASFPLAVAAGTHALFGEGFGDVAAALVAVMSGDVGFRIGVARAIVRSATQFVEADVLEYDRATLAKLLRSTGLARIVSILAQLGDVALASRDAIPVSAVVPWSAASAPTLTMVPAEFAREMGASALGREPTSGRRSIVVTSDERKRRGSRISTEDREAFEAELEAQYVPFYFHDLRTNEIVSFHAFLQSLTDEFTPEWESTDGFGRVEGVRVYKSTSRRIGASFSVAAMNPADFDEMWAKLNKLVTLVYPQFDAGRFVTTSESGDRFVQPFSQTFAASPIVRLRVGDVVRSGRTSSTLARLFGYGEQGLRFDGADVDYGAPLDPQAIAREAKRAAETPGTGYTFTVAPGLYPAAPGASVTCAPVFDAAALLDRRSFVATVVAPSVGTAVVAVRSAKGGNATDSSLHGLTALPAERYEGGLYVVPIAALEPTPETIRAVVAARSLETQSDGTAGFAAFLSEDSNAVVRSFREAGGAGLAGTIDSLSFDMLDRTVWETGPDRRAPTIVRVTFSFTPIHDVAPGLDRLGAQRIAAFPVGPSARF